MHLSGEIGKYFVDCIENLTFISGKLKELNLGITEGFRTYALV